MWGSLVACWRCNTPAWRLLAMVTVAVAWSGVSYGDSGKGNLRICNYSQKDAWAVLGRDTSESWFSTGWYHIPPGSCRGGPNDKNPEWDTSDPTGQGMGRTGTVYYMAKRNDGVTWGGAATDNRQQFCVPSESERFRWVDVRSCQPQQLRWLSQIHLGGTTKAVTLSVKGEALTGQYSPPPAMSTSQAPPRLPRPVPTPRACGFAQQDCGGHCYTPAAGQTCYYGKLVCAVDERPCGQDACYKIAGGVCRK